jgi:hypothetical protein
MSVKDVFVWLFARNTKPGSRYLHGDARQRQAQRLGQYASNAYHTSQAQQGRDIQHEDEEVKVVVKNGWDRRHRRYVTDILVIPRDGTGDRYHVVLDAEGNELLSEFHEGNR